MPRRYHFPHLLNARDLGGYGSRFGGETRWKRFIRADGTGLLTDAERQALVELGVTDAIDLRGAEEAALNGCGLSGVPGIRYFNIPLAGEPQSMGIAADEARTGEFYLTMAENAPAIRAILEILAEAEGIALFHCTAGKDRTGIVAAILLLLGGVPEDDIVADYMVSEWYIREAMARIRRMHPDMPEHFARSRPGYMESFLRRLLDKYGSVEAYLGAMDVPESTVRRLRGKLLEK